MLFIHGTKLHEGDTNALNGNFFATQGWLDAFEVLCPEKVTVICDNVTYPLFKARYRRLTLKCIGAPRCIFDVDFRISRVLMERPDWIYFRPTGQLPLFPTRNLSFCGVADLNFIDLPVSFVKKVYKVLSYRWSFRRAQGIICVSKFTLKRVAQAFPSSVNKLDVIYNGLDSSFSEQSPHPLGQRDNYFLAFCHQSHKNVEMAMRVVMALRSQGEDIRLYVVGFPSQPSSELLELRREPMYTESVRVLGRVSDEERLRLYRRAKGIIFMSKYEGFGLPVLEAMACGTPVICSNAGALAEVAGGNAFLHPINDDVGVIRSARLVIDVDPDVQAKVGRGIGWSRQFQWTVAVKRFLEIIEVREERVCARSQ